MAVVALAVLTAAGRAGTINVWACHGPDGQAVAPADRWSSSITATGIHTANSCAGGGVGYLEVAVDVVSHPSHSNGTWKFTAPSGTTVTAFSYLRAGSVQGWSDFAGFKSDQGLYDAPNMGDWCGPPTSCRSVSWSSAGWSLANQPGVLLLLEACAQESTCDSTSNGWYRIASADVVLEDTSAPTFSTLSGTLASGSALRGSASLAFQLADIGVGLYKLHATVDGRSWDDRTLDTNGGHCVPLSPGSRDFGYAVPCPLSLSAGTSLDTSTLLDGQHTVDVTVEDAAGNTTTVFDDTVTTHNAPAPLARPEISGTTKVGTGLAATTGSWAPTPTGYAYQWLRCPPTASTPADADACVRIAGATSSTYVPLAADAYSRVMVRVTAANANGSDSSVSAPSDLVADAQGRTVPPVSGDGGSRDVVIVPLPPGPGSSSSTTIIVPPGGAPIAGLQNPLARLVGHVANGTHASEHGRVHVAFEIRTVGGRRQVTVLRSTRNRRWVIKGRLTNPAGTPIGGGQLVTAWQVNGRWVAHTGVKTRADGRFTYVLPKGPSRQIRFVYFAFSDSTSYSQSNTLVEKVATPVTLAVAPHATTNRGRAVTFRGTVGTDELPKGGVLVRLDGRAPGDPWKEVKTVHTHAGGRFTITYAFTGTTVRTRYAFRVVVDKQADYPFEGGVSRPVEVFVSP